MKKLIVAVAVLGLCISFAQAQATSLTLRPMFGFGFGTGRQVAGTDQVWNGTKTTSDENMYYSAGGGIKFGLGLDVDIAEHIALGLDAGYSLGLNTEIDKYTAPNSSNKTEAKTSYLPISLTLKVKSKLEKITVFAGMGPTMLMAAKGIETFSETGGTAPEAYERETTFKMGLGYHALAGIEYGLTDKVNFIAQLRADQVSIKTDKDELTKYTVDGVDKLSDVPVRYKNTTYLEDDTTDNPSKDTVPAIERAYMVPANNFTLNIGISYGF